MLQNKKSQGFVRETGYYVSLLLVFIFSIFYLKFLSKYFIYLWISVFKNLVPCKCHQHKFSSVMLLHFSLGCLKEASAVRNTKLLGL